MTFRFPDTDVPGGTDIIICNTAMNYIYAVATKVTVSHDVVCSSEEVLRAVKLVNHPGLRRCTILNLQPFTSFSHAVKARFTDSILQSKQRKDGYERVFLSFPDGWHFAYLSTLVDLNYDQIILLDDGIGNLTETEARLTMVKRILASIFYRRGDIFSRGRNFHHHKIKSIATIYAPLLEDRITSTLQVFDVTEEVKRYIGFLSNKLIPRSTQPYGIYVQSDHAAYSGEQAKLLQYLMDNIKHLEDRTGLRWLIKSKASDPMRIRYAELGLGVFDVAANLELLYEPNMRAVCTRYDTFLLNSMIFNIPLSRYLRQDPSKNGNSRKVEVVNMFSSEYGFELETIPGNLNDY